MKIAVLADTHDHVENTEKALKEIKKKGVDTVIHAGDFCSPFMLPLFKGFKLKAVLGNNDADVLRFHRMLKDVDYELEDHLLELTLNKKNIAVYHGTAMKIVSALAKSGDYDVVIHGHDHTVREEKVNDTIVVNPGSLNGFSKRGSYAILDLESLHVVVREI